MEHLAPIIHRCTYCTVEPATALACLRLRPLAGALENGHLVVSQIVHAEPDHRRRRQVVLRVVTNQLGLIRKCRHLNGGIEMLFGLVAIQAGLLRFGVGHLVSFSGHAIFCECSQQRQLQGTGRHFQATTDFERQSKPEQTSAHAIAAYTAGRQFLTVEGPYEKVGFERYLHLLKEQ
jgi:hypothetical protein